jgi:hypothetical protein
MSRITYFAVLPFSRDADGDFLAEAAIDAQRCGGQGDRRQNGRRRPGSLNLMLSLVTLAFSMLVRSRAVS